MPSNFGHNAAVDRRNETGPMDPLSPADPALWEVDVCRRIAAGDERALADLYDQFGSFVYGLAARVLGDRSAAEDVTQEVFVTLWERPELFDAERGRLRTLLGTLAHRRAVDHVRREEARRRRHQREDGFARSVPDVDEMAMALVNAERVRAAVDALPREQRDAIQLAYFAGKTYREVAEILDIPEGTAKSRMRLGLARIAQALEAHGIEQWT